MTNQEQGEHPQTTRLAPSPTGSLHLGNARTFLINWAIARRLGWKVLLRIEDLDGPRIKPGAERDSIETLTWLGLDWDGEPLRQSSDLTPYIEAMQALTSKRLVYPCQLTRRQIEASASAPLHNEPHHETHFPPELRPPDRPPLFEASDTNWRLETPDLDVAFTDAFAGPQLVNPSQSVGDIVLWSKRGLPSYQLAVVIDDHRQGVTQVVRGDDLLDSTARQLLIQRALDLTPEPRYTHLPLVTGEDGRKLAKRHGDTRLTSYQKQGAAPERLIGLLAGWSGLDRRPMTARQFAERFDLANMPRGRIVFTADDDAWLRAT